MENYDYSIFLSDSSDDYPRHHQLKKAAPKESLKDTKDFKLKEVIRLARSAIQPWWTEEYKDSTEKIINEVEAHFEKNYSKTGGGAN
jgi:hypothetical protein